MVVGGVEKLMGIDLIVVVRFFDGVRWCRYRYKGICLCIDYFR